MVELHHAVADAPIEAAEKSFKRSMKQYRGVQNVSRKPEIDNESGVPVAK